MTVTFSSSLITNTPVGRLDAIREGKILTGTMVGDHSYETSLFIFGDDADEVQLRDQIQANAENERGGETTVLERDITVPQLFAFHKSFEATRKQESS